MFGQFNPKKIFFSFSLLNHVIKKKFFDQFCQKKKNIQRVAEKKNRSEGRRKKILFVEIRTTPPDD